MRSRLEPTRLTTRKTSSTNCARCECAACGADHQRPSLGDRWAYDTHAGYRASLRVRKQIEEAFGWIKTIAGAGQDEVPGPRPCRMAFTFAAVAHDLVRLPKLIAGSP
jgi:hypothetical protein